MANRCCQRHQIPVMEHRRYHCDVEQMPGAQPRIVGNQHVARPQACRRIFLQQRLYRDRHRQVENRHGARRMGQAFAVGVEQVAGKILCFGHDQTERGAHDGVPHLLHHRHQPRPHNFERYRIGLNQRHRVSDVGFRRNPRRRRHWYCHSNAHRARRIHHQPIARPDDGGGLTFLDNRGAGDFGARRQRVTIIDRGFDKPVAEIGAAGAFMRHRAGRQPGLGKRQLRDRPARPHANRNKLDRHASIDGCVTVGIGGNE